MIALLTASTAGTRGASALWQPMQRPHPHCCSHTPQWRGLRTLSTPCCLPSLTASDILHLYLHARLFKDRCSPNEDPGNKSRSLGSLIPSVGQATASRLPLQWVWHPPHSELGHELDPTRHAPDGICLLPTRWVPVPTRLNTHAGEPSLVRWRASPRSSGLSSTGRLNGNSHRGRRGFPRPSLPPCSNGMLCCPAGQHLHDTRTPTSSPNGSLRVIHSARLAQCSPCPLRAHCQEAGATKPRMVSALL